MDNKLQRKTRKEKRCFLKEAGKDKHSFFFPASFKINQNNNT